MFDFRKKTLVVLILKIALKQQSERYRLEEESGEVLSPERFQQLPIIDSLITAGERPGRANRDQRRGQQDWDFAQRYQFVPIPFQGRLAQFLMMFAVINPK